MELPQLSQPPNGGVRFYLLCCKHPVVIIVQRVSFGYVSFILSPWDTCKLAIFLDIANLCRERYTDAEADIPRRSIETRQPVSASLPYTMPVGERAQVKRTVKQLHNQHGLKIKNRPGPVAKKERNKKKRKARTAATYTTILVIISVYTVWPFEPATPI